jgi:hypothetical protein
MLLNYFIKKYIKGRDVDKIKDIVFEKKLKYKENDLEYLNYLKTIFNEEKYIKILEKKIYIIVEQNLPKNQEIKDDQEEEEVRNFIEKYPTNSLKAELKKRLLSYQLKKIMKTKNLNTINNFIQKHPEYHNDDIKNQISDIVLIQYKKAPLATLKRFIENNKDYKNIKELEETYIEKAYNEFLSFYEYDKLMELDKEYKIKKYQKEVMWFKNNKDKVIEINKLIKSLYASIPYQKEEENKLYEIARNTKEESDFLIKSAFFTNDINVILKKVSSHFLLIQISALKALEYYYNQDITSRRTELTNKYKSIEKFKNKYYREKIILIALVLNDEKLFFKYLNELTTTQNRTLWINFLRYNFLKTRPTQLINLIYELSKIDFKVVYSDKTLEKNRIDRKLNLALTRTILNNILNNIQTEKIVTSKDINSKLNKLEHFFKDIDFFEFSLVNDYEDKIIENFNTLNKETKINDFLKENIINYSPIVKIKKRLKQESCSRFCTQKDNLYKIFFKNMD